MEEPSCFWLSSHWLSCLRIGGDGSGDFAFGNRIQVVDIEGELVDSRPIIEQLKRYEDSKSVPAILLNVDSPGGGVAASQEIYTEIKRLREKKNKIVVAYMSSVGASGAYYLVVLRRQDHRELRNDRRKHRRHRRVGELRRPAANGRS